MSTPQRYELDELSDVSPSDDGKFVLFSDYEALKSERDSLKQSNEDSDDFMAFMAGSLADMPCCCDSGAHKDTPPMFWPELIHCIVRRAVKDKTSEIRSDRDELRKEIKQLQDILIKKMP